MVLCRFVLFSFLALKHIGREGRLLSGLNFSQMSMHESMHDKISNLIYEHCQDSHLPGHHTSQTRFFDV